MSSRVGTNATKFSQPWCAGMPPEPPVQFQILYLLPRGVMVYGEWGLNVEAGRREGLCGEDGRGCTWVRHCLTAMIRSRNESQAARDILGWTCGGSGAMLLSTPGLCHGVEGCGKRISHGSCMRRTKPTPCCSGSAEHGTCQELH